MIEQLPDEVPSIQVTEIGEFIRFGSCERRFKLGFNKRAEAERLPFFSRLFNPLDPVLQEAGRNRENDWQRTLDDNGFRNIGDGIPRVTTQGSLPSSVTQQTQSLTASTSWSDFISGIRDLPIGSPAYCREVEVAGTMGAFYVKGKVDFVLVLWNDENRPYLRLIECKASRRDRTYHRVQVAIYRKLAQGLLLEAPRIVSGFPLQPPEVECAVARVDETTNSVQDIIALPPIADLEREDYDIERLLSSEGHLQKIVTTNVFELPFQLCANCDSCIYNIHCLTESARQRRLELLGLEPASIRLLRKVGIDTIDALASLDPESAQAVELASAAGISDNIERLIRMARARISTLPGTERTGDNYPVLSLPFSGQGQLPEHVINGQRLVRIYLCVDYDYVEDRVGALTAHVTTSDGLLYTEYAGEAVPDVKERIPRERVEGNPQEYDVRPVTRSKDVVRYKTSKWTGRFPEDTAAEKELLQGFLYDLVEAIAEVAGSDRAPLHFYVWSRGEMASLVEACYRAGAGVLGHLNQLLGCREGVEQLIYSSLQEEVDHRFALGWTGRGLTVATSLSWFGWRYHWNRVINGSVVQLDHVFTQDIFDFKSTLRMRPGPPPEWAKPDDDSAPINRFEIRSRFNDSLPAPYWRAIWGELPDTTQVRDAATAHTIARYQGAAEVGFLKGYLVARAQALRWIEERVTYKNPEIIKPVLSIRNLTTFSLGVNTVANAALDFLRIDQHAKLTEWMSSLLSPPAYRIASGRMVPISGIHVVAGNTLEANIDLSNYPIGYAAFESNCTIGEGFVRLTPCSPDPKHGQTLNQIIRGGSTCKVAGIDWERQIVRLEVIPFTNRGGTAYLLPSIGYQQGRQGYSHATLDESPSDFVASRVDRTLNTRPNQPVYRWFDPTNPQIPPVNRTGSTRTAEYQQLIDDLRIPCGSSIEPLEAKQKQACIDGLDTRIQLLQGPPGTGKTNTVAIAVQLRSMTRLQPGSIVLVAAHTHTAVDTLLRRINRSLAPFADKARSLGLASPNLVLKKAISSGDELDPNAPIQQIVADACVSELRRSVRGSIVIIGGTTNALLKMAGKLNQSSSFQGFTVPLLVVDEASMMVFPHFLALTSYLDANGEILLAGDHRQLAPIIAHDWDNEDRPPVVLYQPYVSAYDAVQNIKQLRIVSDNAILRSALDYTFRLPAEIRELIARLYRLDDISLDGRPADIPTPESSAGTEGWRLPWESQTGLFLVVHGERESRNRNEVEAAIIRELVAASGDVTPKSIAVLTPHRAQRTLLKQKLTPYIGHTDSPVGIIDTVERLQGNESPTVIVSATESDPTAISMNAEFIIDLRRSNVAFSRAQERLVVLCSESLLDHIPAELDHYQSAMLWKALRLSCPQEIASIVIEVEGESYPVKIYTVPQSLRA